MTNQLEVIATVGSPSILPFIVGRHIEQSLRYHLTKEGIFTWVFNLDSILPVTLNVGEPSKITFCCAFSSTVCSNVEKKFTFEKKMLSFKNLWFDESYFSKLIIIIV